VFSGGSPSLETRGRGIHGRETALPRRPGGGCHSLRKGGRLMLQEILKARYNEIGVGIVQSAAASGEKFLWTTVLLGEK
jgi:hypothetical protein